MGDTSGFHEILNTFLRKEKIENVFIRPYRLKKRLILEKFVTQELSKLWKDQTTHYIHLGLYLDTSHTRAKKLLKGTAEFTVKELCTLLELFKYKLTIKKSRKSKRNTKRKN